MIELLSLVLEKVSRLPDDRQDYVARAMMTLLEADAEPEEIDPAHLDAVRRGLAQARRGEFATDEEVEAAFRSFGE